jgi:hypothetical protein
MKLLCSCVWSDSVGWKVRRCLLLGLSVEVVTKGCHCWLCFEIVLEMLGAIEGDNEQRLSGRLSWYKTVDDVVMLLAAPPRVCIKLCSSASVSTSCCSKTAYSAYMGFCSSQGIAYITIAVDYRDMWSVFMRGAGHRTMMSCMVGRRLSSQWQG